MQFNRHSGVHLVCIQMSVQIIAIANEPPSAILLILLTRGVNCCCSKATSGVWGHHLAIILMYNTLICKQYSVYGDVGVYPVVSNQCEYLWQKRGVYYFRRKVPNDVQQHYERSQIVICLKTKSKSAAIKASRSIVSKLDDRLHCEIPE